MLKIQTVTQEYRAGYEDGYQIKQKEKAIMAAAVLQDEYDAGYEAGAEAIAHVHDKIWEH